MYWNMSIALTFLFFPLTLSQPREFCVSAALWQVDGWGWSENDLLRSDIWCGFESGGWEGHLHATACVWRSGQCPGVSSLPGRVEAGPVLVCFLLYCIPQAGWLESFQLIQLFHVSSRNSNDKLKLSGLWTSALVPSIISPESHLMWFLHMLELKEFFQRSFLSSLK